MTTKPEFAAFNRVQQNGREDDVFAVIAMLGNMTLAEVFSHVGADLNLTHPAD